jgi:hypothetical protein
MALAPGGMVSMRKTPRPSDKFLAPVTAPQGAINCFLSNSSRISVFLRVL